MIPFFLLESVPAGRLFALDVQTLVQITAQLINIAILAFFLTKFLYKPVQRILSERSNRIQNQIQTAETEKNEAKQLKSKYEQIMKEVEAEKNQILETARKQAAIRSEEQEAQARNEVAAIKARAAKEIELEQDRVRDELKQTVINVSSTIAAKFLSQKIDAETHERLFNETMAELEGIAWRN